MTAPFTFGWFDFEPEPEGTGDGSGDPDKHILTIVADPGGDNDEVAVIVHRTCDGRFPIDGPLAESKRQTAEALVEVLNASGFATTLQAINLRSRHE